MPRNVLLFGVMEITHSFSVNITDYNYIDFVNYVILLHVTSYSPTLVTGWSELIFYTEVAD